MTGASAAPPSAAKRQFSLVDTGGIGRPKPFTGATDGSMEWMYKMMSFINAAVPDLDGSLDWAENQEEESDQELIKQSCNRVGTYAFAKELHSAITHLVEREPLRIEMGSTNGLKTWRLLSKQYHWKSEMEKTDGTSLDPWSWQRKLRNRFTVLAEHDDEIQDLMSTTARDLWNGVHDQHLIEEDYQEQDTLPKDGGQLLGDGNQLCGQRRLKEAHRYGGFGCSGKRHERNSCAICADENVKGKHHRS